MLRVTIGLLPLLALLLPLLVQPQALFLGSQGGGYAMLSIATNPVSANTALQADRTPEIHITPNPLRRGTPITFQVNGIPLGTRMAVTVTNIVGNRIHIEEIRASPSATLTLATEGLPAGIYLISFSCPRHNITRRLTITQ